MRDADPSAISRICHGPSRLNCSIRNRLGHRSRVIRFAELDTATLHAFCQHIGARGGRRTTVKPEKIQTDPLPGRVHPSKTSKKAGGVKQFLSSAGGRFGPQNRAMMTSTGPAQRVGRDANHFRKLQKSSGERIRLAPDHANRSRGLWIPKASDRYRRRACLHRRGHFRDQGHTHPGANHLDKRR